MVLYEIPGNQILKESKSETMVPISKSVGTLR